MATYTLEDGPGGILIYRNAVLILSPRRVSASAAP